MLNKTELLKLLSIGDMLPKSIELLEEYYDSPLYGQYGFSIILMEQYKEYIKSFVDIEDYITVKKSFANEFLYYMNKIVNDLNVFKKRWHISYIEYTDIHKLSTSPTILRNAIVEYALHNDEFNDAIEKTFNKEIGQYLK